MTTRPLDPIFSPRSVAVIGASRDPRFPRLGAAAQPRRGRVHRGGLPGQPTGARRSTRCNCFRSVGALPDPLDLAVILVPAAVVPSAVEECLTSGRPGPGRHHRRLRRDRRGGRARLEARLRETRARRRRAHDRPQLHGGDQHRPRGAPRRHLRAGAGPAGVDRLRQPVGRARASPSSTSPASLGIGLTQFVSMGNKADVSGNDLLEYWEHDPATRVICMYLESFGNPRRFTEIAKRVARRKPILVVKSGRTAAGARAASSHTGALAGADVTVSAFLDQCGVLRADTIEELFDVARALDRCPLPAGRRVAIVTNAGGPGIMATDACVDLGLEMAELSDGDPRAPAALLPAAASARQSGRHDRLGDRRRSTRARSPRCSPTRGSTRRWSINVTPLLGDPRDVLEAVGDRGARRRRRGKPVLAVMMAIEAFYEGRKSAAATCRRSIASRNRRRARSPSSCATPSGGGARAEATPAFRVRRADDRARERVLAAGADGYLPTDDAFRAARGLGIPVARWRGRRRRATEALAAAARSAIRWCSRRWPPASSTRASSAPWRLDLAARRRSPARCDAHGAPPRRRRPRGRRLASCRRWPRAGHEDDLRHLHRPPLRAAADVRPRRQVRRGLPRRALRRHAARRLARRGEIIRGIRGLQLLEGVRGEPPADIALLEDVLLRLAWLVHGTPEIARARRQPLPGRRRSGGRPVALDVRVRVGPPPPCPNLYHKTAVV